MIQSIAFDLDGVLCRTTERALELAQAQGLLVGRTVAQIDRWDWHECFPGEITQEQVWALYGAPECLQGALPCPHLRSVARHLYAHGTQVHIVTARGTHPDTAEKQRRQREVLTKNWLTNHRIHYHQLVFSPAEHKADHVQGLGWKAQVIVEDSLETALLIQGQIPVLLIDQPYNQCGSLDLMVSGASKAGVPRVGRIWRASPCEAWGCLQEMAAFYGWKGEVSDVVSGSR